MYSKIDHDSRNTSKQHRLKLNLKRVPTFLFLIFWESSIRGCLEGYQASSSEYSIFKIT